MYSIGQISLLSNLSTHTIRAWERRHCVVEPLRSKGGTRRYTDAHLRRFQLLKAAVEAGSRIGDIANLNDDTIADLSGYARAPMSDRTDRGDDSPPLVIDQSAVDEIIDAAVCLDVIRAERALNVQYRVLGSTAFSRQLCPALLTQIGSMWEAGQVMISSEHLVSACIKRMLLRSFDAQEPRPNAPKVMFSTPDEEQHELGLLIAAECAYGAGAQVINLGPQMPAEAVATAAEKLRPKAVALSSIHVPPGTQRAYLVELRAKLDLQTEIWIGGRQALKGVDGCLVLSLEEMAGRIETWAQASM